MNIHMVKHDWVINLHVSVEIYVQECKQHIHTSLKKKQMTALVYETQRPFTCEDSVQTNH